MPSAISDCGEKSGYAVNSTQPRSRDEVLLEQRVVDVMAGVPLVARQVDGAIDVNRQIGVDLDQAAIVALIPVVATPRLVRHVLDGEALVRAAA